MASEDRDSRWRTSGIWAVAVPAIAATRYFGRGFFIPIVLAMLLSVLFRPIVRRLERAHVPTSLGAAVVVLTIVAAIVVGTVFLAGPLQSWVETAPARLETAQQKLNRLRRPMLQVKAVAEKLEHVTEGPTSQPVRATPPAPLPTPSVGSRLLGTTTSILGGIVEVLVVMYLLLASGRMFVHKLIKVLPLLRDKHLALGVVEEVEAVVARYMTVTAVINVVQGTIIGLVFWWLGMPSPVIWGAATIAMEFVPYLGAAIMIAFLSITSLATFDTPGQILAPAAAYLLVTTIQNHVVSPIAYGNHLKMNPVAVLVGVLFCWFLWGIPGAFLAVPIMATLKIVADRVETLKPLGEFLGE